MQIAVNCKWPSAMKIMEQYILVLHLDTISLQTRARQNCPAGSARSAGLRALPSQIDPSLEG